MNLLGVQTECTIGRKTYTSFSPKSSAATNFPIPARSERWEPIRLPEFNPELSLLLLLLLLLDPESSKYGDTLRPELLRS